MKPRFYGRKFYFAEKTLQDARVVVWGLPWDCTTSYRPGARFGPQAIRAAFEAVESYSPYQGKDLEDMAIHDAGDMELAFGDTVATMDAALRQAELLLEGGRKLVTLGGEHLLSYPVIQACAQTYGHNLHILHVDAHCDLREEYLGVRFSHATAMHLVKHLVGPDRLSHFFLRSGNRLEWQELDNFKNLHLPMYRRGRDRIDKLDLGYLKGRKLYLTVDIDVFDPALVPATGVPDAGGINFEDFIELLEVLSGLEIVAADLMELAPEGDQADASAVVAAKILRELLLAMER